MTKLDAYKHVAAISTLEKWLLTSKISKSPRYALSAKAFGLVYHDRYLCEDTRTAKHAN